MDVICFLCLSLCTSTAQLHESIGSRRACACSEVGFSSQDGDRVWEVYYRRAAFCCAFFFFGGGAKELSVNDIYKEFFSVTVGSVFRVKLLLTGSKNSLKNVRKSQMMADQVRKWLRRQSRDFYASGFRLTDKAMGQVYRCWWRIYREINVFLGSNSTCFTFYIHL
jgi:hypothetical protein